MKDDLYFKRRENLLSNVSITQLLLISLCFSLLGSFPDKGLVSLFEL